MKGRPEAIEAPPGALELSRREHEVLALIAEGRSNREIADALVISLATAERHVHNILTKLGCANRTAASVFARADRAASSLPHASRPSGLRGEPERPTIRYARAADGSAIAYTVIGAGRPLLYLQPYAHQQIDYDHAVLGPWYRRLARHNTLIRIDLRGWGLSSRDPARISLEGHLSDIEAVVEQLGLERFSLLSVSGQGYAAVTYAARHPDQVTDLIIWGIIAAHHHNQRAMATAALAQLDTELFIDAQARWMAGDVPGDHSDWADYVRATITAEGLIAYHNLLAGADALGPATNIGCRCLVVFASMGTAGQSIDDTRELATRLPGCEFLVAESYLYPHLGPDQEGNARIIERFLQSAS